MNRNPKWINSKFSGDDGGGYCAPSPRPIVPTKGTVYIKQVAEENFMSGKGSIINRMDVYYVCESEGYGVLSVDDMVIERLKRVIQIKDNWDDLRSI